MAKNAGGVQRVSEVVGSLERLRLRISAMVGSPKAQAAQRAVIWRLESDTDQAWCQVLEELAETDGLEMTINDDGTVLLEWEAGTDGELPEEGEAPPDLIVQRLLEAPAPF